ncbi:hypothetical protein C6497_11205 [Candidatus Poribacteria bacterium]|nr:MAG: hypothetical protein C6497_11205 [Candidatus Poribacteria bacterium]
MIIPPPDYDKIEKELWIRHGAEVRDLLVGQDAGLMRRIRTFCSNFDFDEEIVSQKIHEDFMFACCFAKDAKKTGFEEKEAEKYLRMFPDLVRSFKVLPRSGKNAVYINESGEIINGNKPSGSKSIDFMWIAGDTSIRCLAAHKVTREAGGAQDHQRDELIRLLMAFQKCIENDIALFVICDGPYYTEQNLSKLLAQVRNQKPYSFASPIGDVPRNIRTLISNYQN